jgi:integrase
MAKASPKSYLADRGCKMIAATKPDKPRSSQTAIRPPADRVIICLYTAALAVVQKKSIAKAAQESGVSLGALKAYRHRYPEHWERILKEAETKFQSGETLPPISLPTIDPGLTIVAQGGIQKAAMLLSIGMTLEEVTKELRLKPSTIRHWQQAYPVFWRRCNNKAINPGILELSVENPAVELKPEMSLTEFYRSYVLPICLEPRSPAEGTLKEYSTAMKFWKLYTGDPPVNLIDARTCATFIKMLSQRLNKSGEQISPNTVRKLSISIQFIFDRLGRRSRHNRTGAGLMPDVPYLEKPHKRPKTPDPFTLDEISAWIEAAKTAKAPRIRGLSPARWWKALILFTYNSGLRIGSVMRLRWSMLEGNVLNIPGRDFKGGYDKQFVLSAPALEAIEPLRKLEMKFPKIFPWNYELHYLQVVRCKMMGVSRIPLGRRYGFHALRKAHASFLSQINPFIAQASLGHTSLKTTLDSYIRPGSMVDALNNLPQPK